MDSNPRPFARNPAFLRLLQPRSQPICTPIMLHFAPLPQRQSCKIEPPQVAKYPRMACRTPRDISPKGCRLPQIDQCQVDYIPNLHGDPASRSPPCAHSLIEEGRSHAAYVVATCGFGSIYNHSNPANIVFAFWNSVTLGPACYSYFLLRFVAAYSMSVLRFLIAIIFVASFFLRPLIMKPLLLFGHE
jgi:hypothetical protein